MKIKIVNNKLILIFSYKKPNINFSDLEQLEEYLKKIFLKLKKYTDDYSKGFFIINIYLDKNNGMAIEIQKEDLDYIDFIDNHIDMKIIIHDSDFLYKINDILDINSKIKNKYDLYIYKDKYYLRLLSNISNKDLVYLTEFCDVIYDTNEIIECGKKAINML